MGNPVPKLVIKNCQFKQIKNRNIKDFKGNTVQYIRTQFELVDETNSSGFPGIWWGHYEHEIPHVNCDAIVELDFNSYDKRFEVRLVEVRPMIVDTQASLSSNRQQPLQILDFRQAEVDPKLTNLESITWVKICPGDWSELQSSCRQALRTDSKLALDYRSTNLATNREILEQLIGIAKYLATTNTAIELGRVRSKLNIRDRSLRLGLDILTNIGFQVSLNIDTNILTIELVQPRNAQAVDISDLATVKKFFASIEEERFKRNYFMQVPIYSIG
jgi:single-stranded-DNA-specific exonuclease